MPGMTAATGSRRRPVLIRSSYQPSLILGTSVAFAIKPWKTIAAEARNKPSVKVAVNFFSFADGQPFPPKAS